MTKNLRTFLYRHTSAFFLIGLVLSAAAQEGDKWSGSWEMEYKPWPHIPPIHMELQIAKPIANMLYPTRLSVTYGDFEGVYELLLVKKNEHQLGVGRNKVPISEHPFALGPWMMYLNGTFDYEPADTVDQLRLSRLWIDRMGIFMRGLYDNEFYTNTKVFIRDFLYRQTIVLRRTDATPLPFADIDRMIRPDSVYYGIYDPVPTDAPMLSFSLHDEERYDQDTVTVVHNGRVLVDGMPLEKTMELDQLELDTGENYIAFFADNYGALPPNTANFLMGTTGSDAQLFSFDFSNRSNAYATVMVARFQYTPLHADVTADAAPDTRRNDNRGRTGGRRDVRIGQWRVQAEKIQLEIWDEQVADGDVISIEVNGARVVDQAMVANTPKRFGVTLKPGSNRILFSAENLGRIPPNTAALRITAGGRQQIFHLNTNFERNNVLDIIVEN